MQLQGLGCWRGREELRRRPYPNARAPAAPSRRRPVGSRRRRAPPLAGDRRHRRFTVEAVAPLPFLLSLPSVLPYLLLTFEALSPWNRSRPWRSPAAAAVPLTCRSRPSSTRSGCHPPDPRQPRRSPRLGDAAAAPLACNQVSICDRVVFFPLGLGKRCIRVGVWSGRVFVRPGKLLNAVLAEG